MSHLQWQKMLIIDFECTCFQDEDLDKPKGWNASTHQEITEMGCVIVNLPKKLIEAKTSFLVRPEEGPMGEFCKELTGLTFDDVRAEDVLEYQLRNMKSWSNENGLDLGQHPWGSWGAFDRVQLFRETARKGIKYPLGRDHYNLKGMFSMMTGRGKGVSVAKAVNIIGRQFEGTPHRGLDDAINIAEIFLHTLKER